MPNFDSRAHGADDWLVAMKMSERGKFAYLDESVTVYTRHAKNITNNYDYMVYSFANARKIYLDSSDHITNQERKILMDGLRKDYQFYGDLAFGRGDYVEASRRYRQAWRDSGISSKLAFGLALSLLPKPIINAIRSLRTIGR